MRLEFEFIQVAMGLREQLSAVPSVHEWRVLFEFCKRQSLLGIGFAAVEKLHEVGVECPADIRLQWYGYALKIERMNEKLNMQCGEITKQYEHDGLQCCILKGQGNLLNYPEGLSIRRMPGDIDVWATPIKYLIHTENTEGNGCPKADDVGERLSITDDRLMILFTRKTRRGTDVRKRTMEENVFRLLMIDYSHIIYFQRCSSSYASS